jgi:hypothetical protein
MTGALWLIVAALAFGFLLKPLALLCWKIRDWFVWRMRDRGEWVR